MKTVKILMIIGLCLIALSQLLRLTSTQKQLKENRKSFSIDSVIYHPPGKDNTLQATPYWKCHLKGTNEWIRVTENKEVGDSLHMIVKY